MFNVTDAVAPFVSLCSLLAAVLFVVPAPGGQRALVRAGSVLLVLASAALVLALAHAALLPAESALVHADGSTGDPRVPAALALAGAALIALLPALRSLRLASMAALGLAIPGLVFAGALTAVASFAHLHQPLALSGLALGAFVAVTAIVLAVRGRGNASAPLALQAAATGVLAIAAMLSLHGARLGAVALREGTAVDTLGQRLEFAGVETPPGERRLLRVTLFGSRDSLALTPELRGASGGNVRSIAAAGLFSGPIVVPIALEERRDHAHPVQWVDRKTPLEADGGTIRLAGFRFVPGDTIRMFADLDVTTASGTQRVSPGVFATPHGETPFAAEAKGVGAIAVASIDADHGRVGLMLAGLPGAGATHVATLDMRLRPALPVAWAAAALALVACLFALAPAGTISPRRA